MAKRATTAAKEQARTRAVGYIRVSTEKQADAGVSLEAQRAKLRAYADLYDVELIDVVVDTAASAKSLERPGLSRVRKMLRAGQADAVVVAKLDRLTRSVRDLATLLEEHFHEGGAGLLVVAEQVDTRSAAGRLVLNVLMSVAQWERETIGERTSAAMQHMRETGTYTGGRVRFGYRVREDGRLEKNDAEQQVITRAIALRDSGMSLREIASMLAEEGHTSRGGRAFDAPRVLRMLRDSEEPANLAA